MDDSKVEKKSTIFNVQLAKVTGLFQIWDQRSVKLGNYNVYSVVTTILALFTCLVSVLFFINGLIFWTKDAIHRTDTVFDIVSGETYIFNAYKMLIIVYRSSDILDCMSITRFDFTSLGREHARLLKTWRGRSIKFSNLYAYTGFFCVSLYVLCPLGIGNKLSMVTEADGSTSSYRINVLNLYTFFSSETYNAHFFTMYLIEAACVWLFVYFFIVFDTLLGTLCLSLTCQLRIVNVALERLGPRHIADRRNTNNIDDKAEESKTTDDKAEESKTTDEQCAVYNDLVTTIKCHQAVLKKHEMLISIFGNIVLSQIVVSSSTIVIVLFTIIKKFTDKNMQSDTGSKIIIIKLLIACPTLMSQLFIACYLFEFICNEKESMIFSLYNSNWTEMDMKCKKLILLTMKINNSNKNKLKFSQLRVVNLEMFLGTMRVGYSVLSVLLKT